ncbi:shikimate dehydrogenase [Candidatus Pelagibacter bacterium]|nr:shikimate dehydrogenase [Candidatus Pelagibacter bacterium]MDA9619150.1 shikimate dehydrogenase [Candidatus Pelagibacter bacterium]
MKKKFGIIGDPIKHSLSPVLHEYWFKKYSINADYSIIETSDNELPKIIEKIKQGKYAGINVTLPFKQKIINHVDKVVNDAEFTGSVNTVLLDSNNTVIGENTDVYGLQAAYLKEIDNSSNKKALVIGAGGVSPSVILSIQKSGIRNISLTNRTNEKCIFLKKKFNFINIIPWVNLKSEIKNFDIIINATSLGLKNGEDFNFNFSDTKHEVIYIDTIYNPLETKTFKYLREEGRRVFNGLDMFIYQGQKSFYLWNKINPEIDDELVELLNLRLK